MKESSKQNVLAKGSLPLAIFLFLAMNTTAQNKLQFAWSLNNTYYESHTFRIGDFIFYNSVAGESAPFSISYQLKEFKFLNRETDLNLGLELNRMHSLHTVSKEVTEPDALVGGTSATYHMRELALPIQANIQIKGILHFVGGVSYSYMIGSQKLIGFDRNSITNNYWTEEEYQEAKSTLDGIIRRSVFSYQVGGALIYKRFSFTLFVRKSISNAFRNSIDFQGSQVQPFLRYTSATTRFAYRFPINKKRK